MKIPDGWEVLPKNTVITKKHRWLCGGKMDEIAEENLGEKCDKPYCATLESFFIRKIEGYTGKLKHAQALEKMREIFDGIARNDKESIKKTLAKLHKLADKCALERWNKQATKEIIAKARKE